MFNPRLLPEGGAYEPNGSLGLYRRLSVSLVFYTCPSKSHRPRQIFCRLSYFRIGRLHVVSSESHAAHLYDAKVTDSSSEGMQTRGKIARSSIIIYAERTDPYLRSRSLQTKFSLHNCTRFRARCYRSKPGAYLLKVHV